MLTISAALAVCKTMFIGAVGYENLLRFHKKYVDELKRYEKPCIALLPKN